MHGAAASTQSRELLAWYDVHRRELPWRARPGETADPYRVWLSEIMLQQTTVQAVAGYYRKFIARWPDVQALAAAPLDDVLAAWAGLGYYARARNLHKAAQAVAAELGGVFPKSPEALRKLPGIGPYTAGAIAAIAFGAREAAMDANAERVIARLFAVQDPLPRAKPMLLQHARSLVPPERPGDFAQALMDLGALICTVKHPACARCPLNNSCEAHRLGIQETLPAKAAKPVRPLKRGAAFVARNALGAVLLVKRPEKGLLGGMLQPPLGPWSEKFPSRDEALRQAPFPAKWKKLPGVVRHGFTHFELEIEVYCASKPADAKPSEPPSPPVRRSPKGGEGLGERAGVRGSQRLKDLARFTTPSPLPSPPTSGSVLRTVTDAGGEGNSVWVPASGLADVALPTVMRKVIAHAITDEGSLFRHAEVRAQRASKRQARSARKR